MAEDDIYGSKAKYERFKKNLELQLVPPVERGYKQGSRGPWRDISERRGNSLEIGSIGPHETVAGRVG